MSGDTRKLLMASPSRNDWDPLASFCGSESVLSARSVDGGMDDDENLYGRLSDADKTLALLTFAAPRGYIFSTPHGHSFRRTLFSLPCSCVACGDKIWGVFSSGCQCLTCGAAVHRSCCTSRTLSPCEATLRRFNRHIKQHFSRSLRASPASNHASFPSPSSRKALTASRKKPLRPPGDSNSPRSPLSAAEKCVKGAAIGAIAGGLAGAAVGGPAGALLGFKVGGALGTAGGISNRAETPRKLAGQQAAAADAAAAAAASYASSAAAKSGAAAEDDWAARIAAEVLPPGLVTPPTVGSAAVSSVIVPWSLSAEEEANLRASEPCAHEEALYVVGRLLRDETTLPCRLHRSLLCEFRRRHGSGVEQPLLSAANSSFSEASSYSDVGCALLGGNAAHHHAPSSFSSSGMGEVMVDRSSSVTAVTSAVTAAVTKPLDESFSLVAKTEFAPNSAKTDRTDRTDDVVDHSDAESSASSYGTAGSGGNTTEIGEGDVGIDFCEDAADRSARSNDNGVERRKTSIDFCEEHEQVEQVPPVLAARSDRGGSSSNGVTNGGSGGSGSGGGSGTEASFCESESASRARAATAEDCAAEGGWVVPPAAAHISAPAQAARRSAERGLVEADGESLAVNNSASDFVGNGVAVERHDSWVDVQARRLSNEGFTAVSVPLPPTEFSEKACEEAGNSSVVLPAAARYVGLCRCSSSAVGSNANARLHEKSLGIVAPAAAAAARAAYLQQERSAAAAAATVPAHLNGVVIGNGLPQKQLGASAGAQAATGELTSNAQRSQPIAVAKPTGSPAAAVSEDFSPPDPVADAQGYLRELTRAVLLFCPRLQRSEELCRAAEDAVDGIVFSELYPTVFARLARDRRAEDEALTARLRRLPPPAVGHVWPAAAAALGAAGRACTAKDKLGCFVRALEVMSGSLADANHSGAAAAAAAATSESSSSDGANNAEGILAAVCAHLAAGCLTRPYAEIAFVEAFARGTDWQQGAEGYALTSIAAGLRILMSEEMSAGLFGGGDA